MGGAKPSYKDLMNRSRRREMDLECLGKEDFKNMKTKIILGGVMRIEIMVF